MHQLKVARVGVITPPLELTVQSQCCPQDSVPLRTAFPSGQRSPQSHFLLRTASPQGQHSPQDSTPLKTALPSEQSSPQDSVPSGQHFPPGQHAHWNSFLFRAVSLSEQFSLQDGVPPPRTASHSRQHSLQDSVPSGVCSHQDSFFLRTAFPIKTADCQDRVPSVEPTPQDSMRGCRCYGLTLLVPADP